MHRVLSLLAAFARRHDTCTWAFYVMLVGTHTYGDNFFVLRYSILYGTFSLLHHHSVYFLFLFTVPFLQLPLNCAAVKACSHATSQFPVL